MDVTSRSRPINIELTGTPEAGKTTQMARLSKLLRQDGFIVRTIRESAEIVPTCFKKRSIEANRWMRLKTSADVLCANSEDVDIILIDRGLVDGIIWQEIFLEEGKLSLAAETICRAVSSVRESSGMAEPIICSCARISSGEECTLSMKMIRPLVSGR